MSTPDVPFFDFYLMGADADIIQTTYLRDQDGSLQPLWSEPHQRALCRDCGVDTMNYDLSLQPDDPGQSEWYVTTNELWAAHGPKGAKSFLCIGCLEARVRRPLNRRDFIDGFNEPDEFNTDRLNDALRRP